MTLTRAFFFVLLLANIGLAVLLLGPMQNKSPFAGHTGEPERLSNQLNPERITLTAPTASGRAQPTAAIAVPLESVVATTSETAAESAPAAASEPATAPTPAPAAVASATCLLFPALTPDQIQSLSSAARTFDASFKLKTKAATPASYWVHLAPAESRDEANLRVDSLKAVGVKELFVVQDGSAMQNAISLGVYRSEAAAQRQLDALKKMGVQGARVNSREPGKNGQVEINGSAQRLETFRKEDKASGGLEAVACPAA